VRNLRRNKQKMYYSNLVGETPIYERDENGNIKYIAVDGTQVPVETGETEITYTIPAEMYANISFSGDETTVQEFGVDMSSYDAVVVCEKGRYALTETSIVWFETAPSYKDQQHTIVDADTADYEGVSIKDSLNQTKILLKHRAK